MIDYKNDDGIFFRKVIDNNEFCIREEVAYFLSEGKEYHIPIKNISQVYSY
jgi:hypothetical protein